MAGRHGVPAPERRTHARSAAGARRRRAQDRDAAQPWGAWLAVRGLLVVLVLAAATWSVLLLTQSRGGIWPVIALAAGALSLLMIGLDVRARARQRARWAAAEAPGPTTDAVTTVDVIQVVDAVDAVDVVDAVDGVEAAPEPLAELRPELVAEAAADPPGPPLPGRRRAHRK